MPLFKGDRLSLEQAFLNILFNATEAMPDGGHLTLTTRWIREADNRKPSRLSVSIRDTGVGIAPKQQKRLFEAFFTLRPMGVGLGLSVVQRVVKDHNGSIRVKSKPGRGSVFILEFPIAEETEADGDHSRRG
jgi:signal transduction histidine kinase